MSYEDEVRRQMENAANQEAQGQCPVEDTVDAAFGFREMKKAFKKLSSPMKRTVKRVGGRRSGQVEVKVTGPNKKFKYT